MMKKLLFSLLLSTIIAICWVLTIHTLKWIAIKGSELELLTVVQPPLGAGQAQPLRAHHQSAPTSGEDGPSLRLSSAVKRLAEPAGDQGDDATSSKSSSPTTSAKAIARRPSDRIRRRQEPQPVDDQDSPRARAEMAEATAKLSPVIERQTVAQKRRLLLSSIASQQKHRQPLESASGDPYEPVMESMTVDSRTGELNDGDELISLTIQPTAPGSIDTNSFELGGARSEPEVGPTKVDGFLYRAPFFTSWFISTWSILFMPVFALISSCCFRNEENTTKKLLVESINQFMDNGLTTWQFLERCALFSLLWIGTIFGIVYSLYNIDATVVMALFACSVTLVYLLSWVLLHQQFVGVRIVAVIICTTGIALLAYMDNSRTLGSVLIVAGSALCSAVYKVIYQRMFGFWSIAQMSLFFTLIGLFNAFLMWPIALLLHLLGLELIVWRYIPWIHLTAVGALHLSANILAYFGPICSYEIFLTLGLLFAVILSSAIDVNFYKITFAGMKLSGVMLLMVGFLVCLLPDNWNEFLYELVSERFARWKKQRSIKKNRNKVQDVTTGQTSRLRTPSGRVK